MKTLSISNTPLLKVILTVISGVLLPILIFNLSRSFGGSKSLSLGYGLATFQIYIFLFCSIFIVRQLIITIRTQSNSILSILNTFFCVLIICLLTPPFIDVMNKVETERLLAESELSYLYGNKPAFDYYFGPREDACNHVKFDNGNSVSKVLSESKYELCGIDGLDGMPLFSFIVFSNEGVKTKKGKWPNSQILISDVTISDNY